MSRGRGAGGREGYTLRGNKLSLVNLNAKMGAFNSESFRIRNSGHFSKIINHHSKFNIDPENFVENIEQFRNQDS